MSENSFRLRGSSARFINSILEPVREARKAYVNEYNKLYNEEDNTFSVNKLNRPEDKLDKAIHDYEIAYYNEFKQYPDSALVWRA